MATESQKADAVEARSFYYKVRPGYFDSAKHLSDQYLNLGYNYRGKLLRKTTSPELWANPIQAPMYAKLERMIGFLVEQAKYVKKTFSFAHNKDDVNIN